MTRFNACKRPKHRTTARYAQHLHLLCDVSTHGAVPPRRQRTTLCVHTILGGGVKGHFAVLWAFPAETARRRRIGSCNPCNVSTCGHEGPSQRDACLLS